MLADLGLLPGAMVFRAEAGDLVAADDLLARAWDLDTLAASYTRVRRRRSSDRARRTDEARCADLVDLVHEWRRFPFLDPEHPGPPAAPPTGPAAPPTALFTERHDAWSPGAIRWFAGTPRPRRTVASVTFDKSS